MKIDDLIKEIETIAPIETQEEWDNSGYQIKLTDGEISRVLVSLEISEQVIDEAIIQKADLIVTHHPLIFRSITSLSINNVDEEHIIKLIKNGISVYSTHTPFDKCKNGNNAYIGSIIGVKNIKKMETDQTGFCMYGDFESEKTINEIIEIAGKVLKTDKHFFSYSGKHDAVIKKVGWCTGAGGDFADAAKASECDLFITGDVKYHTARHCEDIGLNVLDCGHFGTERIFVENMSAILDKISDLDIIQSRVDLNPFTKL